MSISYKDAGVNIDKGDKFVDYIKSKMSKRYTDKVISGVGGFSSIYKISDSKFLSVGTDGVGTKLKIAVDLGIHNTIGVDLVAMNVNDIICSGAAPSFFMDYLAYSDLDLSILGEIIDGINGLLANGDNLLITIMRAGKLISVDLTEKTMTVIGGGIVNGDGIGILEEGGYTITSFSGEIYHIVIKPEYQHMGYGEKIMKWAEEKLYNIGYCDVFIAYAVEKESLRPSSSISIASSQPIASAVLSASVLFVLPTLIAIIEVSEFFSFNWTACSIAYSS